MDLNRRSIFLEMLIAFAGVWLLLGVTLPVVQFTKLFIFTETHSILAVIKVLFSESEWLLAGILLLFSLLFPAAKLVFLLSLYVRRIWGHLPDRKTLTILHGLGRWSMLDVLVLALVVFYAKQQGIADATALPGIYFFLFSVLFTMWASEMADQQFADLRKAEANAPLLEDQRVAPGE